MAKPQQKSDFDIICDKLDKISKLLEHSLTVQLYINGATQSEITKNLHFGKTKVNEMVKGIKKMKINNNEA